MLIKSLCSIEEDIQVDVLIVDDGSIKLLNKDDLNEIDNPAIGQIIILTHEQNLGANYARNTGLQYITEKTSYQYIGILDSGDLCKPHRFDKQSGFFESNLDISVLGTFSNGVDTEGNLLYTRTAPTVHKKIVRLSHIYYPFNHSTVMLRTDAVKKCGFYDMRYQLTEDLDYLLMMISKGMKVAILPDVLVTYEVNPAGLTITKHKKMYINKMKILIRYFNFTPWAFYGLAVTVLTYSIPHSWKLALQKILFKKKNP